MVHREAVRQNVPVELAAAVSKVESNNRCDVVGSSGERGPLQVLPSTAKHIGFPRVARGGCAYQIRAGIHHLRLCLNANRNNKWLAAACHNQGLSVHAGVKPYKKAAHYADAVMRVINGQRTIKSRL